MERAATIVRLAQCCLGDILARRYLLAQRLQNTVMWPGIRQTPGDEYAVLVEEYQRYASMEGEGEGCTGIRRKRLLAYTYF